jgi:hypothetical protein
MDAPTPASSSWGDSDGALTPPPAPPLRPPPAVAVAAGVRATTAAPHLPLPPFPPPPLPFPFLPFSRRATTPLRSQSLLLPRRAGSAAEAAASPPGTSRCCRGRLSSLPPLSSARGPDLHLDRGGPGGGGAGVRRHSRRAPLRSVTGCSPCVVVVGPGCPCAMVVGPTTACCRRGPAGSAPPAPRLLHRRPWRASPSARASDPLNIDGAWWAGAASPSSCLCGLACSGALLPDWPTLVTPLSRPPRWPRLLLTFVGRLRLSLPTLLTVPDVCS